MTCDMFLWQRYLPCSGCRSTCNLLTNVTGTLSEGSGSYMYPSQANCEWILAPVTNSTPVALTVADLNTEGCCDFLRVFSCSNLSCSSPQLVGQLSGTYLSKTTVLVRGYMLVQFTSDGGINGDGFTATWKSDAVIPAPVPFLSTVSHF